MIFRPVLADKARSQIESRGPLIVAVRNTPLYLGFTLILVALQMNQNSNLCAPASVRDD